MNGWTWDDVQALPDDVYAELIAMLNEDADKE